MGSALLGDSEGRLGGALPLIRAGSMAAVMPAALFNAPAREEAGYSSFAPHDRSAADKLQPWPTSSVPTPSLFQHGMTLYSSGQAAEAAAAFRQCLAIDPENADAWNVLGLTLRELTNIDAAIDCYRRAVHLRPEFLAALVQTE